MASITTISEKNTHRWMQAGVLSAAAISNVCALYTSKKPTSLLLRLRLISNGAAVACAAIKLMQLIKLPPSMVSDQASKKMLYTAHAVSLLGNLLTRLRAQEVSLDAMTANLGAATNFFGLIIEQLGDGS